MVSNVRTFKEYLVDTTNMENFTIYDVIKFNYCDTAYKYIKHTDEIRISINWSSDLINLYLAIIINELKKNYLNILD